MPRSPSELQQEWKKSLADLPERKREGEPIPAFFFGHGHPGVAFPLPSLSRPGLEGMVKMSATLALFLKDFGPILLDKYQPKAIVAFSAHWETSGHQFVTDYGNDQPLLYDYYGFPEQFYTAQWHSNGSKPLSNQVVSLLNAAGIKACTSAVIEPRGMDGKVGPKAGLDHGVFIPSMLMFPEGTKGIFSVPIVQVSIDASLDPAAEIALGKAVSSLRKERVLILCGGQSIHSLRSIKECDENEASPSVISWERAIVEATEIPDEEARLDALKKLTKHPGFRIAHPREEHLVPLWIAAGAGSEGEARVVCGLHGCKTIAFGI